MACSVTRLGSSIEWAIRKRTCKLLYVLSAASNHKPGPLQELHVAQTVALREGLRDFIIPLRVDDTLAYSDINIQLARVNAIDFTAGWAIGLHTLLKKLQQDGVQKDARYSAASVASWWQSQFGSDIRVRGEPEEYLSN
jgi:TIR domain-containing protein